MEDARWAQAEVEVDEVDLGLGTTAQLDICTGTAVCTRHHASPSDPELKGGQGLVLKGFCWLHRSVTTQSVTTQSVTTQSVTNRV